MLMASDCFLRYLLVTSTVWRDTEEARACARSQTSVKRQATNGQTDKQIDRLADRQTGMCTHPSSPRSAVFFWGFHIVCVCVHPSLHSFIPSIHIGNSSVRCFVSAFGSASVARSKSSFFVIVFFYGSIELPH